MPPCWTTSSHQLALAGLAVAGAPLVRVLAVAQGLGLLQRQVHASPGSSSPSWARRTSWRWRRRRRRCGRRRPRPGGGAARRTAPRRGAARPAPRRRRPGRPPSPRGPSSWPRPAPWSDRRRRSARWTGWPGTGTGCTPPARWARCPARSGRPGGPGCDRSARMPPWRRGWRVLTRPPSISGAPVTDSTVAWGMPASCRAAAVPPLAISSWPSSTRPRGEVGQAGLVVHGQQDPHGAAPSVVIGLL